MPVGLELNGTHKLLAYIDDVNLLGEETNTIEAMFYYSCVVGQGLNVEKSKYMVVSHYHRAQQSQ
jgi:hypothetical protein